VASVNKIHMKIPILSPKKICTHHMVSVKCMVK